MVSNNIRRKNLNFMYKLINYKSGGCTTKITRDSQYKRYDVSRFSVNVVCENRSSKNILVILLDSLIGVSSEYEGNNEINVLYFKNGSKITIININNEYLRISC